VTTGLVDELPDLSGLAERWGRGVRNRARPALVTRLPWPGVVGYSAAVGSLKRSELAALVAEAAVDCYNDDEQLTGRCAGSI
jgi:hypothetical protein